LTPTFKSYCGPTNLSKEFLITKQTGSYSDYYEVGKLLGEGAHGDVRIVTNKKTGKKRAAKFMRSGKWDSMTIGEIENEIKLLAEIDHPNVMRVHEWYQEDN
jgi:serine/threonine protein kinase